jgi:peptidoglycan/LPS O-acetylase OafA/YrhL
MKVIVQNMGFAELLPHLGASLLYVHNIIYNESSWIAGVAWSLEIEIQFYLLAPFLAVIYSASKLMRRVFMMAVIFLMPTVQKLFGISSYNFFGTMQYFFVGLILVDIYLCRDKIRIKQNIIKPLGTILLALLILVKRDFLESVSLYPLLILLFYILVLKTEFWKRAFQNRFLTSIGGMCYSIYLLHFSIISIVGNRSFSLRATNVYSVDILIQCIIHLPIILLSCAIFYLMVEKPCMNPYWPQQLWGFIRDKSGGRR